MDSAVDRPREPLLSVVIPVLDEEECVSELRRRVLAALEGDDARLELLFIDDGSRDATPRRISELHAEDERVKYVRFTRNFGHQAALCAGLRFARGDAVVTMDGDLQHPPEALPEMLARWRAGADLVQMVRRLPDGERPSWQERGGRLFYRVINSLSRTPVVPAGADFRLLDRRVVDAFELFGEHFVFLRGLVPWMGFETQELEYEVAPRYAGRSKYSLMRMASLALNGIVSFSVVPLRLIALLGLVTTVFGLLYGVFILFALARGQVISGWTSLMVVVLVFGGVQLISLGIVSEYVGRIYEEVKRRPRYIVAQLEGVEWQ